MNFHEIKSLFFREIPHAVSYNRSVREPLALYIVNYNPSCQKCQLLKKAYSSLFDDGDELFYCYYFHRGFKNFKILKQFFDRAEKCYVFLFADFPCIVSEKSYLDLFPHNRIVYLTPGKSFMQHM